MKMFLRLMLVTLLAFGLAACKKDQVQPEATGDDTMEQTDDRDDVTTRALDPRDYSDERNLDNPDSLLSERVIYFDLDSSQIKSQYQDIVAAHADYLAANDSARVTLEGHADERGSREYNLGLGERRGNSVSGAMSADGARGSQLEVVSYGEERPTCRESNESCWSENRRVEIVYNAR